jgi:hypothetical protein
VLELVDRLERHVVAGEREVAVAVRPVLPAVGEPGDHQVEEVLLVPQLVPGPPLEVERVVGRGDLERPVAVRQLADVEADVGQAAEAWRRKFSNSSRRVRQRNGFE